MTKGFQSPNHTQTPNDLFEMMSDMKEAELRFTLAICRLTFGYHRKKVHASLTTLKTMTGMSTQGILNGAEAAEKRGTVSKIKGRGVNEWVVNVVDMSSGDILHKVDKDIHDVDTSTPPSGQPSIKERIKEVDLNKESSHPTWSKLLNILQPQCGVEANQMLEYLTPRPLEKSNGRVTLVLVAPDPYCQTWVEQYLLKTINRHLPALEGSGAVARVEVSG